GHRASGTALLAGGAGHAEPMVLQEVWGGLAPVVDPALPTLDDLSVARGALEPIDAFVDGAQEGLGGGVIADGRAIDPLRDRIAHGLDLPVPRTRGVGSAPVDDRQIDDEAVVDAVCDRV